MRPPRGRITTSISAVEKRRTRPPCKLRLCHDLGHHATLSRNPNFGHHAIHLSETLEVECPVRANTLLTWKGGLGTLSSKLQKKKNSSKNTFIQKHFRPKTLSSKTISSKREDREKREKMTLTTPNPGHMKKEKHKLKARGRVHSKSNLLLRLPELAS